MDQKFWANQVKTLNIGPAGTHISAFSKVVVEQVDYAFSENSSWQKNAKQLQKDLTKGALDSNGITGNVKKVEYCLEHYTKAYKYAGTTLHNLNSQSSSV